MRIFSILIFLAFSLLMHGQNIDTLDLKAVEVHAEQRQIPPKAIPQTLLQQATSENLAELLTKASSLYIKNYGPGTLSTISLHGASASQTKLSWNGILLNNPLSGQVDLSLIPGFLIDELEVNQNMESASFGGSINLKQSKVYKANSIKISSAVGAFGKKQVGLKLEHKAENTGIRVGFYRVQAANNFDFVNTAIKEKPRQEQLNAGYQQQGLQFGFQHYFNRQQIESNLWLQEYSRKLPNVMSYQGAGRREAQIDKDFRFRFAYKKYWGQHYFLQEFSHSKLANNYEIEQVIAGGFKPLIHSSSIANNSLFKSSAHIEKGNFSLDNGFSVSLEKARIYSFTTGTGNQPSRSIISINSTAKYRLRDQTILGASVDYKYWKDYNIPLSGELRISNSKQWSQLVYSYAIYAQQNVRIPTLNDVFWQPGGNLLLKPENAKSLNLQQDFKYKNLTLNIYGYLRNVSNWIQWRPSDFAYWKPFNLEKVISRGVDIQLSAAKEMGGFKLKNTASLAINRAYEKAEPSKTQLMYMPKTVLSNWVFVNAYKWEIGLGYQLVSRRETQTVASLNSFHKLPQYSLFHSSVSRQYKQGKGRIALELNNLLNQQYQNILWRAMPGFSWELKWIHSL